MDLSDRSYECVHIVWAAECSWKSAWLYACEGELKCNVRAMAGVRAALSASLFSLLERTRRSGMAEKELSASLKS
eukprot:6211425-Pleurochrysis_carterae.AAC.1